MNRGSTGASARIGKYEILWRIATGGMAEILLARSTGIEQFQKLVVIKRILPQYARDEAFVGMFLDEARIAATLHHSNIVQVYDIGKVEDEFFLAMEFLHGKDVREIAHRAEAMRRPIPPEVALHIVIGVCAGLHHAHEKATFDGLPLEIVHRDVSSTNIFVTFDGGVKLLDFGIAKATHRITETHSGTIRGKVAYMSPEQCRSLALDRRSDLFSLGIVLWELTTGAPLYKTTSDFETMKQIVEVDACAPSTVQPGYPPELERIVIKALRRPKQERYQTAEELQLDLEAFVREQRLAVSPVATSRFLRELFGEHPAAWMSATHAERTLAATSASDGTLVAWFQESASRPAAAGPTARTEPTPARIDAPRTETVAPKRRLRPGRTGAWLAAGLVASVAGWAAIAAFRASPPAVHAEPAAAAPPTVAAQPMPAAPKVTAVPAMNQPQPLEPAPASPAPTVKARLPAEPTVKRPPPSGKRARKTSTHAAVAGTKTRAPAVAPKESPHTPQAPEHTRSRADVEPDSPFLP